MAGASLGEVIYSSVKPMIRMYMIIGTGFFLTKKGLFGVTTARACSDMVLLIFMPALVFDKVVSYISIDDIKTIGVICFSAFIMYAINTCVALLIVKFTPIPKTPKDRWVGGAMLAGIMQNVSDLPIAYIQAVSLFSLVEQNKGTAYVIIWLAMYVITQFNCGLFQLVEWDFNYTESHYKGDDNSDDGGDGNNNDNTNNNDLEKNLKSINEENNVDNINSHNSHTQHSNASENFISHIQSYTSESPVSPTSSILSSDNDDDDDEDDNDNDNEDDGDDDGSSENNNKIGDINTSNSNTTKIKHLKRTINSHNLNPTPLTKLSSRISEMSKITARSNALARIPSARSMNYEYHPDAHSLVSNNDIMSLNEQLIREYTHVEPFNQNMSKTMKILTETNITIKDVEKSGENFSFVKKYRLHYVIFFLENFKKPNSIALVLSLCLALIPWTKALFTNNGTVTLPNAPDKQPALSFILMYAEYLGYPCVPLGLLLIGSVLARLEFSGIPKGFWKSAVCHTLFRLCILPIIGAAFVTKLKNIGWLTDKMAMFVCSLEFALPSATVQIYLTAGAMRPGVKTCSPLNCFGLYLILQYFVLIVSMPIVVCYCIKKTMDL